MNVERGTGRNSLKSEGREFSVEEGGCGEIIRDSLASEVGGNQKDAALVRKGEVKV